LVGTSALWNTDRHPYECYYYGQGNPSTIWFHPWGVSDFGEENDKLKKNVDGWTVASGGPGHFCDLPPKSGILGIAVNITSNKADLRYDRGYTTQRGDDHTEQESKRMLGVYDVRGHVDMDGSVDQSFRAKIPANVPFEFQLIDATYGLKYTDVRSWHSLKPRETRTNCGGCHQHDVTQAPIPMSNNHYAMRHIPADFTNSLSKIAYDPTCNVQVVTQTNSPTAPSPKPSPPVWPTDLFTGMNTYCNGCHKAGGSGEQALSWAAANVNDFTAEEAVYAQIRDSGFAAAERGALSSQVYWAARGERTDGRPNQAYPRPAYNCPLGTCSAKTKFGFYFSRVHRDPGPGYTTCTTPDSTHADWVLALGQWIDNGMPRDKNPQLAGDWHYKSDLFHPTADLAISTSDCLPRRIRVGWWDDSDQLKSVKVLKGSAVVYQNSPGIAFKNGSITFALTGPTSDNDVLTVEVIDWKDNRQTYKKRIGPMRLECAQPLETDPPLAP
jgi:hypothetical protein